MSCGTPFPCPRGAGSSWRRNVSSLAPARPVGCSTFSYRAWGQPGLQVPSSEAAEAAVGPGQMSRDACIRAWLGSYYLEVEKRWVPGQLALTPHMLQFTADGTGDVLVSVPLGSVTELKKAASHFIFSSITVLEQGGAKHWFSTLRPSRNAAFSVLEHFWRERLLAPGEAAEPAPASRGQELVGLAARSQQRLEDAAHALHHQGRQMDRVARDLDQMEADLDVADRLLTELESPAWWPFSYRLWKTPADVQPRAGAPAGRPGARGKARPMLSIPVVVSRGAEASEVRPGRLTVLASGLEIHDSASSLLHRFERGDVDDVQVHTPYEVTVRQRGLGKPDVAYRLLSARMPEAVRALGLQFSQKMELLGDAAELWGPGIPAPRGTGSSAHQAVSRPTDPAAPVGPAPASRQLQLQAGERPVSEEDSKELSRARILSCADEAQRKEE
ncbi:PREDICTED: synaptosomal-associated protein 47 isoform X2 [Condylura cristata]|uniref:synaptosomal-associated protein 47 isoform X2 n=1 Tax=Condylura cristata TaxID=143302 RepID=UPI000642AAC0|nr:PREDICTED: synaptosomal-associated protein 47 isoform X2 [Condylura cristata]